MPNVDLLPFPVAHPLSYARDESLYVTKRVDNTQFAAYQAIRTTALLLLADYLEGETSCRAVGDAILGLRLPHWKEWVDLCTSLAKYWRGDYPTARPQRQSRFPSLVEGWLEGAFARNARKLPRWEGLLRGLPGGQGPARNAIDAFWTVRNRRAHAEGTRTDDDSRERELLRTLLPLLDAMLDSLFPEGSFQLLRVISEEDPRVIRLHGPHRDLRFEAETLGPEWAGVFSKSSVVAIAEDEVVGIHPLFLAFDPETAAGVGGSGGLIEDLYLIDGLSERKVVGLGVLNWKNLADPLCAEVRSRFAVRQVEFGLIRQQTKPWTLADWTAARSSRRLADMTGRKYFPAFYLERRGVDDFLRLSLAIDVPSGATPSPKGRALLLLGEAGAGKSSILARLVERLLYVAEEAAPVEAGRRLESYEEKRGSRDVVIFLSGADAYPRDRSLPADQLLSEAVTRQGEVKRGEFGSLADFCQELSKSVEEDRQKGRKVWIILDAINEADRFTDLVEALDSFLPEVEQYPWLRLVVSMRSGAYHSLARRDESAFSHGPVVFRNARAWQQFSKASMGPGQERPGLRGFTDGETVPYLDVRPFHLATEGKEAYGLRQRAPGMRACPARWDSLDRAMRELLLSPLHLHLFHETFHAEQNVPAALSETKLLNAYLDQLADRMPGLPRRLLQLGEVMRETRRALLPLELAEAWVKEWRGGTHSAAESLAKLDPVEELVSASVLMRPVEEGEGLARRKVGYCFSHQKLAEAVLVREIEARLIRETGTAIPTPEGLLKLAKEAAGTGTAFGEMVGAIASLVVQAVERGDGASVGILLDHDSEKARNHLVGAGLYAYGFVRGNAKEPTATAAASWTAFTEAISTRKREERFSAAVWHSADVHEQEGRSQAAGQIVAAMVEIGRRLVAAEPDRLDWKCDLSSSLNSLSDQLVIEGKAGEARSLVEESLGIMRELVAAEPGRLDWRHAWSTSLGRLSSLLGKAGEAGEALALLQESLGTIRELVAMDPERMVWRRALAVAMMNLSDHLAAAGQAVEARSLAGQSVSIMRELVASDPSGSQSWPTATLWRQDLAISLSKLSGLLDLEEETEDAWSLAKESLEIMRALVADEPRRLDLRNVLAVSLHQSSLLKSEGKAERVRELVEESLEIKRFLVVEEPGRLDWRGELGASLIRMSELLSDAGETDGAQALAEESLGIIRDLVAAEPERLDLRRDMVHHLLRLSDLLSGAGRAEEARSLVEESLGIIRELATTEPGRLDSQRLLGASLNRLSVLLELAGEAGEARKLEEASLGIARALVVAEPGSMDTRQSLTVSLERLSEMLLAAGEEWEARSLMEERIGILRGLVAAEPGRLDWRRDLAIALRKLHAVQPSLSADPREEAVAIMRDVYKTDPSRHASELAYLLEELSSRQASHGKPDKARMLDEECLDIRRRQLAADPENTECLLALDAHFKRLTEEIDQNAENAAKRVLLGRALEITERLALQKSGHDLERLEYYLAIGSIDEEYSPALALGWATRSLKLVELAKQSAPEDERIGRLFDQVLAHFTRLERGDLMERTLRGVLVAPIAGIRRIAGALASLLPSSTWPLQLQARSHELIAALSLHNSRLRKREFERLCDARRELVHRRPDGIVDKRDLLIWLEKCGGVLQDGGEVDVAAKYLREANELCELLSRADGNSTATHLDAIVATRLARQRLMAGDVAESGYLLHRVLETRRKALTEEWDVERGLFLANVIAYCAAHRAESGLLAEANEMVDEAQALLDRLATQWPDSVGVALEREHVRLQRHRIAIRMGVASEDKATALRNLFAIWSTAKASIRNTIKHGGEFDRLVRECDSLPYDQTEPRKFRPVFI